MLLWRAGDGARVDSAFAGNDDAAAGAVSVHYDSMVAKLIAHAPTRAEAIAKLDRALATTVVLGLRTNRSFLRAILAEQAFVAGETTTAFLTDHSPASEPVKPNDETLLAAAVWLNGAGLQGRFRNNAHRPDVTVLLDGEERVHVGLATNFSGDISGFVDRAPDADLFEVPASDRQIQVVTSDSSALTVQIDAHRRQYWFATDGEQLWVQPHHGEAVTLRIGTLLPAPTVEEAPEGSVVIDCAAVVTEVHVTVGDMVKADDPLVTVEAMKMLSVMRAPNEGEVTAIYAEQGQSVAAGQILVEVQ